MSTKLALKRCATSRPRERLPAPGLPTRTSKGRASCGRHVSGRAALSTAPATAAAAASCSRSNSSSAAFSRLAASARSLAADAAASRERRSSSCAALAFAAASARSWADRIGPGVPVLPQHRSSLAVLPRPRRTPGCCGSEPELRRSPCLGGAHSLGMDNACVAMNAWADSVMTAQVVPRSATRSTCPRAPRPSIAARSSLSPSPSSC